MVLFAPTNYVHFLLGYFAKKSYFYCNNISIDHSRASTAATLTRENQEAPSSRPPSHGSVAVPDSQQLSERPASKSGSVRETNGELKGEGSVQSNRSEKREGESPRAKSREGSKLSKRGTGSAERIGSAEKPKSAADKSVASSKRNSPIPGNYIYYLYSSTSKVI